MGAGLILLALLLLVVFWVVGAFNRLVSLRNRLRNAFAQIDVQLKRRHDRIPNLVETAKGYMQHEREVLEAVIAARSQAMSASAKATGNPTDAAAVQQMAAAEGALGGSLGKLFALSESHPELKANENMMQLTEELAGSENKIAFARQAYNDSVMQYNTAIEQFPSSIIATMTGFRQAELLQATETPEEKSR